MLPSPITGRPLSPPPPFGGCVSLPIRRPGAATRRQRPTRTARLDGPAEGVGGPQTAHVSPEQRVMRLDVLRDWATGGLWDSGSSFVLFSAAWEVFSPHGPHGQSDRTSSVTSSLQLSVEQDCDEAEGEDGSGTSAGRNAYSYDEWRSGAQRRLLGFFF